jgi:hypothetical protein
MLNEEINKYKELYSQLIGEFAELHNHTLVFVKTRGRDVGFAGRKNLRAIEGLAKSLKKQSQLVYKESLANLRAEKKLKREEKKIPKKRGSNLKGNKNDNNQ